MISKFSVVIPLYNKAAYIERAVNSVLNQRIPCDEVIVVDDGSTDNGVEKVKSIASDKIKLIQQKNQGVSAARNTGISACNNEYVLFLDADDIWLPNFTEEIAKLQKNFPEAGLLATAYAFKEEQKIIPARLKAVPKGIGIIEDYFLSCIKADLPVTASSVAIKRSLLKKIGSFPVGMAMGEDQLTWSKIAYQADIYFSNTICVHYDRGVADSACKTNLITDLAPHIAFWQQDLENGKVPKKLRNSLVELLHFSALYCIKNNIKLNNKTKAIHMLFNEPLLKRDHYWFAGLLLACLPHVITKRVL